MDVRASACEFSRGRRSAGTGCGFAPVASGVGEQHVCVSRGPGAARAPVRAPAAAGAAGGAERAEPRGGRSAGEAGWARGGRMRGGNFPPGLGVRVFAPEGAPRDRRAGGERGCPPPLPHFRRPPLPRSRRPGPGRPGGAGRRGPTPAGAPAPTPPPPARRGGRTESAGAGGRS